MHVSFMQGLELGRHIGSGSFSNVFLGKWRNQTVAVKVRLEPLATRPSDMLSVAYDGSISLYLCSRCCSQDHVPCQILQVCDSGISASEGRSLKPWSSVEAQQSRALDHPHLVTTLVGILVCRLRGLCSNWLWSCKHNVLLQHCRHTPRCSFLLRHRRRRR